MTQCTCGLKRGDRVTIIGWNGVGESGCWVKHMDQYVGASDTVHNVDHDTSGKYPCTATLERIQCHWQTEWLLKDRYTLF